MRELVEVLAQSLVDHPEEVTVQETEKDNEILLELKVYACSLCYGRLFLYRKLLTMWCYATKNCFSNSCKAKCWLCFFIGG